MSTSNNASDIASGLAHLPAQKQPALLPKHAQPFKTPSLNLKKPTNQIKNTQQTSKKITQKSTLKSLKPSKYAPFMQATKVKTPKYKFYVEIGGDENAPTIMLISGLGAQMLMWPPQFCQTLINNGFRVIRFDNRDIGKSTKIKKKRQKHPEALTNLDLVSLIGRYKLGLSNRHHKVPYNLFDMAVDTHYILEALGIDNVYLIGSSMGGMIAQIMAAKYPEKVNMLGLLSTSSNKPMSTPPFPKQIMSFMSGSGNSEEEIIRKMVQTLQHIGSPNFFDEAHAEQFAKRIYSRKHYPKGTLRQLMAVFATGSLVVTNKRIHCPTLVVHGSKDRVFLASHGRSLAKSIKNAQFHLIQGMGHDIPPLLHQPLAQIFANHFLGIEQPNTTVLANLRQHNLMNRIPLSL